MKKDAFIKFRIDSTLKKQFKVVVAKRRNSISKRLTDFITKEVKDELNV